MTYDDYLWDRSGPPDPELKQLEDLLRGYRYRPGKRPFWHRPIVRVLVPLAAAASLLLAFTLNHMRESAEPQPWVVSAIQGAPTVDGARVVTSMPVSDGQWVRTDESSRLRLVLADSGELLAEPGTEFQVTSTQEGASQLTLTRGVLYAALWSASDVNIATPSGVATDRNDEFVLAVDDSGHACLSVNTGGVMLRRERRESIVPAGAVCEASPERGLGTPYCESAPEGFREALENYDFADQGPGSLLAVLAESGPCDLVPLWHLLRRVAPGERARIYEHMVSLEAPPPSVTRDGILRLEPDMMKRWWEQISAHKSCMMCAESQAIGVG